MKSAICLIVRNEIRDIAEWIGFHGLAGFDTQIIFDNRSDDGTAEMIRQAGRFYDIRYHHWENDTKGSQVLAYEAACAAYHLEFDWIAFLDSDEFLITAEEQPINAFLHRFDRWSAVAACWAIYGSDGHEDYPAGLVTESFTRRAPEDFFAARHVKSIIRPGFAARCVNPHCFDMRGRVGGSYCDPSGRPMRWWPAPEMGGVLPGVSEAAPEYSQLRVNHYFTRSKAHWRAKLQRGYPSDVAVRKMAEFDEYDRNEIADPIALRYLPALREAVARIRGL